MNKYRRRMIQSNVIPLKTLFIMVILLNSNNIYSSVHFDSWGISKDEVIKIYFSTNKNYIEFSPIDKPDYENKILNYVIARVAKLKHKIKILRSKSYPERDFLLIKDKLFSIKESHKSISNNKLNKIIKSLTSSYGKPNNSKGTDMVIYFFSTKKTKVIVHSYFRLNKCEIFFYDSQLFQKLSSGY